MSQPAVDAAAASVPRGVRRRRRCCLALPTRPRASPRSPAARAAGFPLAQFHSLFSRPASPSLSLLQVQRTGGPLRLNKRPTAANQSLSIERPSLLWLCKADDTQRSPPLASAAAPRALAASTCSARSTRRHPATIASLGCEQLSRGSSKRRSRLFGGERKGEQRRGQQPVRACCQLTLPAGGLPGACSWALLAAPARCAVGAKAPRVVEERGSLDRMSCPR